MDTLLGRLLAEWDEDAKIDQTELAQEATRTPYLHAKYLRSFATQRLRLKALEHQQRELKTLLRTYYRGEATQEDLAELHREQWPKIVIKSEIPEYIEGDSAMIRLDKKVTYQQEIVSTLDSILRAIARREYAIRTALDFLKFTNGQF